MPFGLLDREEISDAFELLYRFIEVNGGCLCPCYEVDNVDGGVFLFGIGAVFGVILGYLEIFFHNLLMWLKEERLYVYREHKS